MKTSISLYLWAALALVASCTLVPVARCIVVSPAALASSGALMFPTVFVAAPTAVAPGIAVP